jgi:hypothetical protein
MKKLVLFVVVLLAVCTLSATSAPRKVLMEVFTSTTCAPCYPADVFYFQNWLPNYGGASQIVTLAYHVWWPSPGNDPMYMANTAPVQTRVSYYQGSSAYVPRGYIDGFIDGTSAYTSWPGSIEGRFLDPSPVSITLSGTRNGLTFNMSASIRQELAASSTNWRVQWVTIENQISEPQYNGTIYVPFVHDAVHRAMYPDANGTPITISQGQTVVVTKSITLNSSWVANNSKVIVFVQDMSTKKVQNVEFIGLDGVTGVGEGNTGAVPTSFALDQNFPNPFNPSTTVSYAVPSQSFVSLKVFNTLGEEVRTLVSDVQGVGNHTATWDGLNSAGKEVPSGTYLLQMTAGQFRATKKLLLLK